MTSDDQRFGRTKSIQGRALARRRNLSPSCQKPQTRVHLFGDGPQPHPKRSKSISEGPAGPAPAKVARGGCAGRQAPHVHPPRVPRRRRVTTAHYTHINHTSVRGSWSVVYCDLGVTAQSGAARCLGTFFVSSASTLWTGVGLWVDQTERERVM